MSALCSARDQSYGFEHALQALSQRTYILSLSKGNFLFWNMPFHWLVLQETITLNNVLPSVASLMSLTLNSDGCDLLREKKNKEGVKEREKDGKNKKGKTEKKYISQSF